MKNVIVSDLIAQYDNFLVDIYGVLYDGVNVFSYVFDELEILRKHNKAVIIISNTTSLSEATVTNLEKCGLYAGIHYDFVVTSGTVMRDFIKKSKNTRIKQLFCKNHTIFAGLDNVTDCSDDLNIDYVYIGIPKYKDEDIDINDLFDINEDRIKIDELLYCNWNEIHNSQGEFVLRNINNAILHTKVPMLCANADTFAFNGDKVVFRQGMVALKYEQMCGAVIYSGKPYRIVYDYVFNKYKVSKDRTVMIGDTPWTDIAGANNVAISSILVKTGSYRAYLGDRTDSLDNMYEFLHVFSARAYPKTLNIKPTHIVERF